MTQIKCGKWLGPRKDDVCYKDKGHEGKCYKSLGLELESDIQEILQSRGYKVIKATNYEDCEDPSGKKDFWIYSKEINGGDGYVPIQFTVNRQAACGDKGIKAISKGVVIIFIEDNKIIEWKRCKDESLKADIAEKITKSFWERVQNIVNSFHMKRFSKPEPI